MNVRRRRARHVSRRLSAIMIALQWTVACHCPCNPPPEETAPAAETSSQPSDTIEGQTAEDLGLEWVAPHRDGESPFVVGGRNETATIRGLESINGIPVSELEKQMRPDAEGLAGSTAGFLGPEESLLEVMATDNETVVETLGLTHQDLARPLLLLAAHAETGRSEMTYRGQRFSVERIAFKGSQLSPFQDGTEANIDAKIHNLDNGKTLELSMLVPLMIERYGFYEGHGTPYRVDPKDIAELLGLAPERQSSSGSRPVEDGE